METVIDKVAWTLIVDRKILMVRPKGKDYFINPGGKREKKPDGEWESDEEVLIREVMQELLVTPLRPFIFDGPFKGRVRDKKDTFVIDRCYRSAGYAGRLTLGAELLGGEMHLFRRDEYVGQTFATNTGELILNHYQQADLID